MARRAKSDTTDTDTGTDDVAALKAEMAALRTRAETAEGRLSTAEQERRKAVLASMSSEERALVSALETSETNIASIENELDTTESEIARLADEPGNGKEIARLNRVMAVAAGKLQSEQQRKEYLTGQQTQFKARAEASTAEDQNDKVLANGSKLSQYGPQTQAWLEAHPKAFSDSRYMARAIAAAIKATGSEGIKDQSPEYFRFIESELGEGPAADTDDQDEGQDEQDDEGEEVANTPRYEAEKPQTRAAGPGSMAAPVAQTALRSSSTGGNRRVPALTAQEKEAADGLYGAMPVADRYTHYAKNKALMQARDAGHFRSN